MLHVTGSSDQLKTSSSSCLIVAHLRLKMHVNIRNMFIDLNSYSGITDVLFRAYMDDEPLVIAPEDESLHVIPTSVSGIF